ncbi:saccharopine dehydrogenase NADP-binding domain-containing protein [Micromonospora okii]|uniref:saccharopine dehydrogenase NADP-binding domain-containing protein n=1 Tax=Micromonospora okii TaxID=1182970 RepID=UPI001E59A6BA|nr:saccharopine dehydrogenase NADP-binding domain-containing protein [Micromonospora okii]
MTTVGVLGCTGAVGAATVDLLDGLAVTVRPAGRNPDAVRRAAGERGVVADVDDPGGLAAFCAGCDVVVDCTGPADRIGDRVAAAALAAGADYVSPADTCQPGRVPAGRRVVLGAGMTPGLSALLPRALAAGHFDRLDRLTAHLGGRDRFTPAAAADYLAGMRDRDRRSGAAWAGGRLVPGRLEPLRDAELPHFPGRVTAHPFLSAEAQWLAGALGVEEVHWYHVFDGDHALSVLGRVDPDAPDAVERVVRAAELDLFGRAAYQQMVFQLDGASAGRPTSRVLTLRGTDSYALTALALALAVEQLLDGRLPDGVSHAGRALDVETTLRRLAAAPAVRWLDVVEGATAVEEGVL